MADDDGEVIAFPSVEELLADPRRHLPPELLAEQAPSTKVVTLKTPVKPAAPSPEPAPPQGRETVQAKPDDTPPLGGGPESFDPAAADYKAFGWAGNHSLPTLLLILEDGRQKAVVYAQLDSDPDGSEFLPAAPGKKGSVIRLRVAGSARVFFVVIEGAGVGHVWELLMAHKTPWLRVLPPGGVPLRRDEPVIWSIGFEPAK